MFYKEIKTLALYLFSSPYGHLVLFYPLTEEVISPTPLQFYYKYLYL